jgi:hypothetical protein
MSEPIPLQSLGPTPLQTPALSLSPSHGSLQHILERPDQEVSRTNQDHTTDVHDAQNQLSTPSVTGVVDGICTDEPPLPDYIPALPPVDGGRQAWSFLVAATMMEMLIWGLPFAVGVLHEYWLSTLFKGQGEGVITLAATLQTGLLYMSTAAFGP